MCEALFPSIGRRGPYKWVGPYGHRNPSSPIYWKRVCHTRLTKRITEAVMGPSRCARPSFQASAAGVRINGWVHTGVGYCKPRNIYIYINILNSRSRSQRWEHILNVLRFPCVIFPFVIWGLLRVTIKEILFREGPDGGVFKSLSPSSPVSFSCLYFYLTWFEIDNIVLCQVS